ncbi:hypothetical protein IHV09_08430 [Fictibacillus sp. 23RED33]|uniref:hypothetical protein n=1 Tax=Fictibacillus sp. 23RED33 TaxID=2745879 RepID=UPI0018CECE73|nr:hypothetical protein [Fictibacillus sp. 23RED33]MBH0173580.1 hypothetical protein [Fictibacillus sp. 23RED33]
MKSEWIHHLKENMLAPEKYLNCKCKEYPIVLLAERHAVKQNLDFVNKMIPELYRCGVYHLGMEFGASEDQDALDELITGERFDEEIARRLIFNYNVKWPYKEYWDLYRAAWELNSKLEKGDRKFRIINLSYKYNWKDFSGVRTPESCSKVFHKGNTEKYRFQIIEDEIIKKNERIVILTGTVHAFTRYHYPQYDETASNFIRFNDGFLGNLIYQSYPHDVFSILLHQRFSHKESLAEDQSPANGQIEELMAEFDHTPMGFDLLGTCIGDLKDASYYSSGYMNFCLKDLFDGYLFFSPISALKGCTVDPHFIDNHRFSDVQAHYPDKDWAKVPEKETDYWEEVKRYVTKV